MTGHAAPRLWLPDLCTLPRLGAMLGLAEVTAVVIMLAPRKEAWSFDAFLSASGYALWLSLSVSVLLCVTRKWLSALPARIGAVVAIALAILVAGSASAIIHGLFASVATPQEFPSFTRFVGGSAAIVGLLTALALRYFYVMDRWQFQIAANARAEADALQARIRPHFLFNSMNLIVSLLRREPDVAERAVLDLSDLFRAALGAGEADSTLAEEVHLAERYLAIEQLRMGDRLQVVWRKQEELPWSLPLPRLVLQPLLENAVLHGVSRLPEGGLVEIELIREHAIFRMRVKNPLPSSGIDGLRGGAGHAQRNIGHRLAYMHGASAVMRVDMSGGSYCCEVSVPLNEGSRFRSVSP